MTHGDPGIIYFQHCDRKTKIFCLELPDYCPICDQTLTINKLEMSPIQIPFPFTKAADVPLSIIIRPTDGDFLHHYQNAADLHIGITDSKGDVYEYDKYGLHIKGKNWTWNQCLSIPIIIDRNEMWSDYWDYTLSIITNLNEWKTENYNELQHNCYSFVLLFLRMLSVKELKQSLNSKTQFCKDFIVPKTKNAAKYISLYRQVIKDGVTIIKLK